MSVTPTGVWGRHSRLALREFKKTRKLAADDAWDEATERSLFSSDVQSFETAVGIWDINKSACSAQLNNTGLVPVTIDEQGALAGGTSCKFRSKRKIGAEWHVVALCSNGSESWTSNVRLVASRTYLKWESAKGLQHLIRCDRREIVADASPPAESVRDGTTIN